MSTISCSLFAYVWLAYVLLGSSVVYLVFHLFVRHLLVYGLVSIAATNCSLTIVEAPARLALDTQHYHKVMDLMQGELQKKDTLAT